MLESIASLGVQVLGAVLILLIGWKLAGWLSRRTDSTLAKRKSIEPTIRLLVVKLVRFGIMAVAIVATLDQFGIETTSLIAVLGASVLAIGLALQGTLTNVAAGVMLLLLRPFKVESVIKVDGSIYIIDDIGLFVTIAHEPDGPKVTLPNNKLWGNTITSFSETFEDRRRINETFGIGYGDDMTKAMGLIKEMIENNPAILKDPEPMIAIGALGESSVDILVHAWTRRADWFAVKLGLNKEVKEVFDREGISIPFPQRDVHIYNQD